MKKGDTFTHTLYAAYLKIDSLFKQNRTNLANDILNWDSESTTLEIKTNETLNELYKLNNAKIFEVIHYDLRLFFLLEVVPETRIKNLFLLNFLENGTIYENHKNLDIIQYRIPEGTNYKLINNYQVAHCGGAFIDYCKYKHGENPAKKYINDFWNDVKTLWIPIRQVH